MSNDSPNSGSPFEDQPIVRRGPGQHPQAPNTDTMPQTDWHDRRTGHAMKEAEAAGHHGVIVIQQEADAEDSGVVQHRDAGRLLRDVPPAYDSIMQ
ncbi:hypothetical protein M405DRAFT_823981 [Rhizopogon salebrosus TDB-379]|nr:hypothetical protein M405DRAFT_823978 [Rhizopogon salebrosus TDB-379]KAJ8586039.1 hypothetical protein M405DRAFT_823981 [Rhizopogon salebrosus TDB-379]